MGQNARFRFFINPLHDYQKPAEGGGSQDAWAPPTDVYETHEALIVKMAIPGVQTGDVRIRFAPGGIVIFGHRDFHKDSALVTYHQMEIRNGRFERRIKVQMPLDPQNTSARYKDGFLTIWIPKCKMRIKEVYTVRFRL